MHNYDQVTVILISDADVSVYTLDKYGINCQRFNAFLPSSALETPRRNRLTDSVFQKLTLLIYAETKWHQHRLT